MLDPSGDCGESAEDHYKNGMEYANVIVMTQINKTVGTCTYADGCSKDCADEAGSMEYGLSILCMSSVCGGA